MYEAEDLYPTFLYHEKYFIKVIKIFDDEKVALLCIYLHCITKIMKTES